MMKPKRVLSYHKVCFSVSHLSTNRDVGLGLDKRPSPLVCQPIDMGWLPARRPVGLRAAQQQTNRDYNDVFGTGHILPPRRMRYE
jgi:hypothetical protein